MSDLRKMLRCKIHRATVTQADLNYEGSITIPPDLLEVAKLLPFEAVEVWNVTNGARFETYSISGKPDSHDICVNGAAARLVSPGDLVIIAAFSYIDSSLAAKHLPVNVFVDAQNRVNKVGPERPGPELV
jgi:aspartate 1-decarboxylase